jgi:phenylalanyl-tRNA synthetase beta chain
LTFSFISGGFADKFGLGPDHPWRARLVPVLNPLSEDHGVLRPSVLPGLLAALRLNQYHGQWDAALFEMGTVFLASLDGPKPAERQVLGGLLSGASGSGQWNDPRRPVDFWDAKGLVEFLAQSLGADFRFSRPPGEIPPFYDKSQACLIHKDGEEIGHLGLLSGQTAGRLGLKEAGGQIFVFELEAEGLPAESRKAFKSWSSYPGVTRDMAILLDRKIPAAEVLAALKSDPGWPLADVAVFDLYQGDKIPPGKKSLALRLFFQERDRTLTDELANGYFNGIVSCLKNLFQADLRS